MADEVLTERRGKVLVITLNRADQMNAINEPLSKGLVAAIDELDSDPGLSAGVLTGVGRAFCAGMDLKGFLAGDDVSGFFKFAVNGSVKPLIAAIDGFALAGGLELALTCDLIVASKGVKMGIPEAKRGLFAAAGGLMRLPTRVGYSKAMEMALTGDPILAEEAAQFGMVARLTEPGGAVEAALELAERIAENAPLSITASKQLIKAALGITEPEFWELQKEPHAKVFNSNDSKEGPLAFAEKRAPNWTGA